MREVWIVVYDLEQRPRVTMTEGGFDIAPLTQLDASFLRRFAIRRRIDRHHQQPSSLVTHYLDKVQRLSDGDVQTKTTGRGIHRLRTQHVTINRHAKLARMVFK